MKTIKESLKTIIIALVVLAGVNFVYAWVEPAQAPPGGNVSLQSGLWSQSGSDIYYNLGNIGIGVINPTEKLEIGGTSGVDGIKFPDGTLQTTATGGQLDCQFVWGTRLGGSNLDSVATCPSGYTITGCGGEADANGYMRRTRFFQRGDGCVATCQSQTASRSCTQQAQAICCKIG